MIPTLRSIVRPLLATGAVACLVVALCACVVEPAHGAYASGVVAVAPPAPRIEVVPVAPHVDFVWLDGYWNWNGGRHVWVGGHWEPPHRGYVWVPHAWIPVHGGYQHLEGHWVRGHR